MSDHSDRTGSDPDQPPEAIAVEKGFVYYDSGKLRANENGRQRYGDREEQPQEGGGKAHPLARMQLAPRDR